MSQKLTEPQKMWLSALRSDEFKQTDGRLQDENGFCCLGVSCIVYERTMGKKLRRQNGVLIGTVLNNHPLDAYTSNSEATYKEVGEWLGLRSVCGTAKGSPSDDIVLMSCTDLNDVSEMRFPEIADHLEKYAEYYFTN